jgi:hypothetical protein
MVFLLLLHFYNAQFTNTQHKYYKYLPILYSALLITLYLVLVSCLFQGNSDVKDAAGDAAV